MIAVYSENHTKRIQSEELFIAEAGEIYMPLGFKVFVQRMYNI
jgi:hypothetical protein